MTELEVVAYLGVCGVTGERQKELLALLNEPDAYRIKPHPAQIPDALQTLIFNEQSACAIDSANPLYLPGIIQTPDYIRALFAETGLADAGDIDRWVDIRLSRREVLTRINPARCSMLIHENALRAVIGSPKVMSEQMLHMLFVSDRPQCAIRVVPASAGGRGLTSSFHIFSYAEDSPLVYVQNETTCEFLESDKEVRAYRSVLKRVASAALSEAESRHFIAWMASQYDGQGAAQHEADVAQE